jgi:hypothetical protein
MVDKAAFTDGAALVDSAVLAEAAGYCKDDESSIQCNKEKSKCMQEHHPVETILHSKLEPNSQLKYLIRWRGE